MMKWTPLFILSIVALLLVGIPASISLLTHQWMVPLVLIVVTLILLKKL